MPNSDIGERRVRKLELILVFILVQFFHTHLLFPYCENSTAPRVINFFPYSTQLSTKFILLINVKMPTIVDILTFISMINTTSERLKAINFFSCRYISFYKLYEIYEISCSVELSMKRV